MGFVSNDRRKAERLTTMAILTAKYNAQQAATAIANELNSTDEFAYLTEESFATAIEAVMVHAQSKGGYNAAHGFYRAEQLAASMNFVADKMVEYRGKEAGFCKALIAKLS